MSAAAAGAGAAGSSAAKLPGAGPMRKLIIQIPCFNEEATLGRDAGGAAAQRAGHRRHRDARHRRRLDRRAPPRSPGSAGATYLLRFPVHAGLARAFSAGLDAALKLGADVIVNTDADHQYPGREIPRLVAPILAGQADMVIGDRGAAPARGTSASVKRVLQGIGSWVVRRLSGTTRAGRRRAASAPSRAARRCG